MITVDLRQLIRLQHKLEIFNERGVAYAVRDTLNRTAFKTRSLAQENLASDFILRRPFTKNSVRVTKASGLAIGSMQSVTGSVADYLKTQEFGGVKLPKGKKGVPIPTQEASGERGSTSERKKNVTNTNTLGKIELKRGRLTRSNTARAKKQRLTRLVQQAVISSNKRFYFNFGRREGIFIVRGGSKTFHRGWPRGAKIRMLWDLSNRSVDIPRRAWLHPAVAQTEHHMFGYYTDSLRFQLKRAGIF